MIDVPDARPARARSPRASPCRAGCDDVAARAPFDDARTQLLASRTPPRPRSRREEIDEAIAHHPADRGAALRRGRGRRRSAAASRRRLDADDPASRERRRGQRRLRGAVRARLPHPRRGALARRDPRRAAPTAHLDDDTDLASSASSSSRSRCCGSRDRLPRTSGGASDEPRHDPRARHRARAAPRRASPSSSSGPTGDDHSRWRVTDPTAASPTSARTRCPPATYRLVFATGRVLRRRRRARPSSRASSSPSSSPRRRRTTTCRCCSAVRVLDLPRQLSPAARSRSRIRVDCPTRGRHACWQPGVSARLTESASGCRAGRRAGPGSRLGVSSRCAPRSRATRRTVRPTSSGRTASIATGHVRRSRANSS